MWLFSEDAPGLQAALEAHHVLVRPKADVTGRTGLRVTIGSVEQTQHVIQLIQDYMAQRQDEKKAP